MSDQPISQLPEASGLSNSDLLVVVNNGETKKTTISTLASSFSNSTPTNGLSSSETGDIQLGGTLVEATAINQDSFPILLQNGSLISTGSGTSPSLTGLGTNKFAWLSDRYAFVAGQFYESEWDDQVGYGSAVFGHHNKNLGTGSVAFGFGNNITPWSEYALVTGQGNTVNGPRSLVGGINSTSNNWSNVIHGNNIIAHAPFATAFGDTITIGEETPTGLGENTIESNSGGFASLSIGKIITNVSDYGIALGTEHELYGNYAYAFGDKVKIEKGATYSSGLGCLVQIGEGGKFNTGVGSQVFINDGSQYSVAHGSNLYLKADEGVSNGPKFSFLMGTFSEIKPNSEFTFALGSNLNQSTSAGRSKFGLIVGTYNNIDGDFHVALGDNHTVQGTNSMAVGSQNNVNGSSSFALGYHNTISSDNSWSPTNAFTLGRNNSIDAYASFALGTNNTISSSTDEASTDSFAVGYGNNAIGRSSFAIGTETSATTDSTNDYGGAYAFGNKAQANGNNSFAYGKYVNSQNGAFVLGSGIEDPNFDRLDLDTFPHTPTFFSNSTPDTLAIGFNSDIPTLFIDKASGTGTTGDVGIGTNTPTAKLHVNGDIKLENGVSVNEIKTVINTASPSNTALVTEKAIADFSGSGSGSTITQFNFSLAANANSTTGLLSKSLSDSTNPGALPTTNPFNQGISSGGLDPYVIMRDSQVKSIRVTFAQAGVGSSTVGTNVSIRMELFKMEYNSRTLIGTYDIPVDSSLVGANNNLGLNSFQTAILDNLTTSLSAGDLIGLQFTNVSGDSDFINAVGKLYVGLETETV